MTVKELLSHIHEGVTRGWLDEDSKVELWYEHPDLDMFGMLARNPEIEADVGVLRIGYLEDC